ncbi:oxygenase MpaB family protein [Microbacterium sp.]|uniref:oxygenase MpaB family protein n=1 Tax=Microbacterium sp. TaxID=51671 RepID=UPI0037CC3628
MTSPPPVPAPVARLRAKLLTALAGDPTGMAPYVRAIADGDDGGYFAENGPAWTVHAGMGTLVAGIRALLLQALHPGALAGVHDWSRYREDPIGRLTGTVRWVITLTYGSKTQADAETARVGRFHRRVHGEYRSGDGSTRTYTAEDGDLIRWVHLAFTDAFLRSHQAYGGTIPGGPDAYVADWATAGRLMRIPDPPTSETALRAELDGFLDRGELRRDARVDEVVRFLRRPPFTGLMGVAYRVLFAAAVATFPPRLRRMLGVRRSWLPVKTATRVILRITERALGSGPRAQDMARLRLRRLGL